MLKDKILRIDSLRTYGCPAFIPTLTLSGAEGYSAGLPAEQAKFCWKIDQITFSIELGKLSLS
jgi:hypothetical protein